MASTRNHLDYFIRERMIGKLEKRRSVSSVVEELGMKKSIVSCASKAFQTISSCVRNVGGGLPRKQLQ